jgi:hypothetical protein
VSNAGKVAADASNGISPRCIMIACKLIMAIREKASRGDSSKLQQALQAARRARNTASRQNAIESKAETTHPALGAETARAVNPDVLGHDGALLVQSHVLGQL